jgi:hypothetical protein
VHRGILQIFERIKEFQIAEGGNTLSDGCEANIIKFKKFQQDDTVQYFIISCQSLYMFRAYPMPIIRSSINCNYSIWGRQTDR